VVVRTPLKKEGFWLLKPTEHQTTLSNVRLLFIKAFTPAFVGNTPHCGTSPFLIHPSMFDEQQTAGDDAVDFVAKASQAGGVGRLNSDSALAIEC